MADIGKTLDSRELPAFVLRKTKMVLSKILSGSTMHEIGGRRLNFDRHQASVRIGYRWRLLVEEVGGKIVPVALLTHEAYNKVKARR